MTTWLAFPICVHVVRETGMWVYTCTSVFPAALFTKKTKISIITNVSESTNKIHTGSWERD